jgi:hypothetical protein
MRAHIIQNFILITLKKIVLNPTLVLFLFFSALISNTNAIEIFETGVIDDNQTGRVISDIAENTANGDYGAIVIQDLLNTDTYRNLYTSQPLPIDVPTSYFNLSELTDDAYITRPFNTFTLIVKGAGTYSFGVYDPYFDINHIGGTNLDLVTSLYAKEGNTQPFSTLSPNTNFIAASDDISNSGDANPYQLYYVNNSSGCVTLSLVYYSFTGLSGNVGIYGSGPGNIVTGSCSDAISVSDTMASLQIVNSQLRSAFNSQLAASNLSLNHDCNLFDTKGMCISAGGRYTTIDNPSTYSSAAVVTLGYKVNPNIRIGGFLDKNTNIQTPSSIDVINRNPLMGLYAVWNKEVSGLGYQLRLANTYQDKDVTTTRLAYGSTGEVGSGTAKLNSQSYLAELSYAFQYQDKTIVRPYFAIRNTQIKRDGYMEGTTDTLFAPLTFDGLSDRSTSALFGTRMNYQVTPRATLTAHLGIEQDIHHKVDHLKATNTDIGELNSIAFNSNIKRTRPAASIGAYYDVTKNQRLSTTINYQQLPFQSTGSATAYVNYMIGF